MTTTIEELKKRLKKLEAKYQRSDIAETARDEEHSTSTLTGARAHRPPPPKVDSCAGSEFM